jgi:MBG domain (YGX type)/Bacterial Ig-like domain (group 3)
MRSRQATGTFALLALVTLCLLLGSGAASADSTNQTTTTSLSINPTQANPGDPITLSATVTGVGNPTGSVEFDINSGGGTTKIGTASLSAVAGSTTQSTASLVTSFSSGVYAITATYKSNSALNFFTSTSASTNVLVSSTSLANTALTLASTPAATVQFGQGVTFTANVSEIDGGTAIPTGTVTFSDITGGADNPVLLGSAPVDTSGNATLVLPAPAFLPGSHSISASYSGDIVDKSASGSLSFQVTAATNNPVPTTATVTATPSSLTAGGSTTLSAHVVQTGSSTTPPTGEIVNFSRDGNFIGQATLDANGNAVLVMTGWVAGTYDVQASYSGDSVNLSSSADVTVVVAPGPSQAVQTTTVVTATPTQITAGQTVTIVANVTQVGTPTSPPTGEIVTFASNGNFLGQALLDANGNATLTVGGWLAGSYDIQASYVGDIANKTSAGDVPLTVTPGRSAPAPLAITAPSVSFTYGGTLPALAAPTYVGWTNGDGIASLSTPATCTTAATSASPAGSYPITCSGASDINYTFTYTAGSVTVLPAGPLKVTASTPTSITYGSALPALTATYSGFVPGESTASLTSLATCTTTASAGSPAGSYPVTCSGTVDSNYTITYAGSTLTIKPASLIVTAPSATITAGSAIPTLTPTYSGFVNNDTTASLTSPATCTTTATINSAAGNYAVTCSGAVDPNYTITNAAGVLTIGATTHGKATTLKYTGDTSDSFGDTATASATLTTSTGSPISGAVIVFTLGSQSCSAVTNSQGKATCSGVLTQPVGNYTVKATFAATSTYLASTASSPFKIVPETTAINMTYSGPAQSGTQVQLSAALTQDASTPVPNETVKLSLGSQSCTATTNSAGIAKCNVTAPSQLGPTTATAVFAGDSSYAGSTDTNSVIVYASAPHGCSFLVGDRSDSGNVTFWGSQWSKHNSLSGGQAPSWFSGYTNSWSGGSSWSSNSNDNGPSGSLPSYMAVYVTSSISRYGSGVSGNADHLVIVKTDPGSYGTGTVVGSVY